MRKHEFNPIRTDDTTKKRNKTDAYLMGNTLHANKGHKIETYDDVISIFRVTGPLCGGIQRPPVNSPNKGQWRGALILFWICAWTNGWVNIRGAGGLRRHHAHYDVTLMPCYQYLFDKRGQGYRITLLNGLYWTRSVLFVSIIIKEH